MRSGGLKELHDQTGTIVRQVRDGAQEVVIEGRGVALAKLVPVASPSIGFWRALQAAERSAARMHFTQLDLDRVFIQADLLSQRHAASHPCGATDVLHVAAAIEQAAPLFLTCDAAQAAGLRVHRFEA